MKTRSFVAFFTLPADADVKRRKMYEKKKTGTTPRLLPQAHDQKVFFIINSSSNH
jgi:hypothetical protein